MAVSEIHSRFLAVFSDCVPIPGSMCFIYKGFSKHPRHCTPEILDDRYPYIKINPYLHEGALGDGTVITGIPYMVSNQILLSLQGLMWWVTTMYCTLVRVNKIEHPEQAQGVLTYIMSTIWAIGVLKQIALDQKIMRQLLTKTADGTRVAPYTMNTVHVGWSFSGECKMLDEVKCTKMGVGDIIYLMARVGVNQRREMIFQNHYKEAPLVMNTEINGSAIPFMPQFNFICTPAFSRPSFYDLRHNIEYNNKNVAITESALYCVGIYIEGNGTIGVQEEEYKTPTTTPLRRSIRDTSDIRVLLYNVELGS